MEFSNAYVDTEVDHINVGIQPQGLAEEAEVKVISLAIRRKMTILCWIYWIHVLYMKDTF
jgi:hypothetical protein